MKTMIFILILVTIQNMAQAATNQQLASLYNKTSVEYKELIAMSKDESEDMHDCIKESHEDKSVEALSTYEATEFCINEVLGDIHN